MSPNDEAFLNKLLTEAEQRRREMMDNHVAGPQDPRDDLEHVLAIAVEEIKMLRKRNEKLEAKMDVYDTMVSIFRGGPPRESVGMREDPLWMIEKKLGAIRYEKEKQFNQQGEKNVSNAQAER